MRFASSLVCAALSASAAIADPAAREQFQPVIADLAKKHDVPEKLIHRIVMRESRYAPRLVGKGNYGLMQIKPATARGMGYKGAPDGLLDGKTNLTYGVPYLANAYHLAGRKEDAALKLYSGGYYFVAKRKGLLATLRTANSPSLVKEEPPPPAAAFAPAPEPEPEGPFGSLFKAFSHDGPAAATTPDSPPGPQQ